MSTKKYKGGIYVAFGDSITNNTGAARFNGYAQIVAEELGCTLVNKGVNGSAIAKNITDATNYDFSNVSLVTLMTGTNGTGAVGTADDIQLDYNNNGDTFIGKIGRFVEIVRCSNPYVPIFLLTPPKTNGGIGTETLYQNCCEAFITAGKKLCVPVIDVGRKSHCVYNMKSNNYKAYSKDLTHPNEWVHERMAECILNEIF